MTDSNKPQAPNWSPSQGGRLTTSRLDFQKHIEGLEFRHTADQIDTQTLITIDGYTATNVESCLVNIAGILNNEHIPLASMTVPGLIQIGGDLTINGSSTSETVVALRGFPVSPTSPSTVNGGTGALLGWNGSSWIPVAPTVSSFGGDLSGTSTSQLVIEVTGSGGTLPVHATNVLFNSSFTNPTLSQTTAISGNGSTLTIMAQDAPGIGGSLALSAGISTGSALDGSLTLSADPFSQMISLEHVATNQRVVNLLNSNSLTTTNVPADCGDYVIFMGDTSVPPVSGTNGTPSGGHISYSFAGQPNFVQSSGDYITLGNPQVKVTSITPDTISIGNGTASITSANTMQFNYFAKLEAAGSPVGLSIAVPDGTTGIIKATFVGQVLNNFAHYSHTVIYCGFIVDNLGAITLTAATNVFGPLTAGSGWGSPSVQEITGNLFLATGANSGGHTVWTVNVDVTLSYAIQ